MDKKITKRDNFNALREIVMNHVDLQTEQDRLITFIDNELELINKRAASAKKYAKKSCKAVDALAEAIVDVLGAEPITIPEIVARVPAELAATNQKVAYRLSKMIENGHVEKTTVAREKSKVNAYAIVAAEETEDEDTVPPADEIIEG